MSGDTALERWSEINSLGEKLSATQRLVMGSFITVEEHLREAVRDTSAADAVRNAQVAILWPWLIEANA